MCYGGRHGWKNKSVISLLGLKCALCSQITCLSPRWRPFPFIRGIKKQNISATSHFLGSESSVEFVHCGQYFFSCECREWATSQEVLQVQGFNCLFDKAAFEHKSVHLQLIWAPLVLRICWVGKTKVNYRVAAHIPQSSCSGNEHECSASERIWWKGNKQSVFKKEKLERNVSKNFRVCEYAKLCISYSLFGTKKSLLCLNKTIPTSHVTYT